MCCEMNRGLALLLSQILLGTLTIGCSDNSSSPTSPSNPSSGAPTDSSLTAPVAQSPGSGEQIETVQPELVVNNATGGSGARAYSFEVATDSAFQQRVASESGLMEGLGGITKWRVPEALAANARFFWRARASTSSGAGPFSCTAEFRIKAGFTRDRASEVVLFDPLTSGSTVGTLMGGQFVAGGWQPQMNTDCIRYQMPTLREGFLEFETTNVSSPNPFPGKRMLVSMWDPSKGEYTTNPFRMHLQKLDRSTVTFGDVRLRWISRGQDENTNISFFDFDPSIVYSWRIEWGSFPGISSQHVKVFLEGFEILTRNYDRAYSPNPHWLELGNCSRAETLEQAIWSNIRAGSR